MINTGVSFPINYHHHSILFNIFKVLQGLRPHLVLHQLLSHWRHTPGGHLPAAGQTANQPQGERASTSREEEEDAAFPG